MIDTQQEVNILISTIKQFGQSTSTGTYTITYGLLFDKTANTLEALNGTLRSAKRSKLLQFNQELLMMPKDKDTIVTLLLHPPNSVLLIPAHPR